MINFNIPPRTGDELMYIGQAIEDSKESGVEDVGSNAGKEDESNEADELAAFANKRKGVM